MLLTNGVDQTVEGAIIFSDGLILDGSSTVDGLVDGVDIPSMVAEAVKVDGDQVITGRKILKYLIYSLTLMPVVVL